MASTGEVGCIGSDLRDAFLKAYLSVGFRIPEKGILLSTGPIADKLEFLESARRLDAMGFKLHASHGTAKFLKENGVQATSLYWPLEKKEPNIGTWLRERRFDLVINVPKNNLKTELKNDYMIRRLAADFEIPLITNIKVARLFAESIEYARTRPLEIMSWQEYKA